MEPFMIFILCFPLLQNACGIRFGNYLQEAPSFQKSHDISVEDELLSPTIESSSINISDSEYRSSEKYTHESSSGIFANETLAETDQLNSTTQTINEPSQVSTSTGNVPGTQSTHNVATLTEIFSRESDSSPSSASTLSSSSASLSKTSIKTTSSVTPINQGVNGSLTTEDDDDEPEGVARGKPFISTETASTTTSQPESLYKKTLALINDTYTLSIVIPVAAGIIFALTIIITIATCRCLRRRCRRRRLRRKALPDSVKKFRTSDRAKLLAESSDEEF